MVGETEEKVAPSDLDLFLSFSLHIGIQYDSERH